MEPVESTEVTSGMAELNAHVEALLFASSKALKLSDLHEMIGQVGLSPKRLTQALDEIMLHHEHRNGGFKLYHFKGIGYQFRTQEAFSSKLEQIFAQRPRALSRSAQETLAIIAYRQPVTRADIEFIRGVDAGSILKNLLERGLVRCLGRREDAGRPLLFGTTEEFLKVYSLATLKDLPPIEAFQPSRDMLSSAFQKISTSEVPEDLTSINPSFNKIEEFTHDQVTSQQDEILE